MYNVYVYIYIYVSLYQYIIYDILHTYNLHQFATFATTVLASNRAAGCSALSAIECGKSSPAQWQCRRPAASLQPLPLALATAWLRD